MSEKEERVEVLRARAQWYADGCPHVLDRLSYYVSGDCARDAAVDLGAALGEIDRLKAENEHLKWNLEKAGLAIAQSCAREGTNVGLLTRQLAECREFLKQHDCSDFGQSHCATCDLLAKLAKDEPPESPPQ